MEDAVGFRNYLFRVGIHLSRYSNWCPRSSSASLRGHAVSRCRTRSLRLDDRARRALTNPASMDVCTLTRVADLPDRLRPPVLGRAACAIGCRRSHDGNHPGLHRSVGDSLPANPEADRSPRLRLAWHLSHTEDPSRLDIRQALASAPNAYGPGRSRTSARRFEVCRSIR